VQSILGIIRSLIKKKDTKELLVQIQDDLRLSMGEIASDKTDFSHANSLDDSHLVKIDKKIQEYQEQIELPKGFITPGDSFTSAMIDLGRTITRRAERRVVAAFQAKIVRNQTILRYVNRLSTLLFFMEIHEMKQAKNHRPIHNHIV
jgi:cob(I)alamin adenosyltransferase